MSSVKDSTLVAARIAGNSPEAIAARYKVPIAQVQDAVGEWAKLVKSKELRDHQFALELARLDRLQAVFDAKAQAGDARAANFVLKIISQRAALMGLFTQPAAMHVHIDDRRDDSAALKVRSALAELSQRLAADVETRH